MGRLIWHFSSAFVVLAHFITSNSKESIDEQPLTRPQVIIFTFIDDLGFSDVGFTHNIDEIKTFSFPTDTYWQTPTIDSLAQEYGIILDRHYVHSSCSPSRAAFLTGKYPFRLGIEKQIGLLTSFALDKKEQLLPTILSKYGNFKTLHLGKWHLGRARWNNTNFNYFDESISYFQGFIHYYKHKHCANWKLPYWHNKSIMNVSNDLLNNLTSILPNGLCLNDLWMDIDTPFTHSNYMDSDDSKDTNDNKNESNNININVSKNYLENIFLNKLLQFISKYENESMFIYWNPKIPHWPIMDPPNSIDMNFQVEHCSNNNTCDVDIKVDVDFSPCNTILNKKRFLVCKMMQYLDHEFKILVNHLKQVNLWNKTLMVVSSDNGAVAGLSDDKSQCENDDDGDDEENDDEWIFNGYGCNLPLRSEKETLFEGGIRSVAFITGGFLPENIYGKHHKQLISVEDWFRTFVNLGIEGTQKDWKDYISDSINVATDSFDQWENIIGNSGLMNDVINDNTNWNLDVCSQSQSQLSSDENINNSEINGCNRKKRLYWIHIEGNATRDTCVIKYNGLKYCIYPVFGHRIIKKDGYLNFDSTQNQDKLFENWDANTQEMLFDLVNDPFETRNIIDDDKYLLEIKELKGIIERYTSVAVVKKTPLSLDALKGCVDT